MGRKPNWPPVAKPHPSKDNPVRSRVRWCNQEYYLPPIGSPEHQAAYAALLARLVELDPVTPAVPRLHTPTPVWPTIRCAAAEWLKWAEAHYTNRDEFGEYRRAAEFLLEQHADTPTSAFRARDLERLRAKMGACGWNRRTCNARTGRIKTIWRMLERWGLAPDGSWGHLCSLPTLGVQDHEFAPPGEPEPTDWQTVVKIANELKPMHKAILLLQWYTGARPSELRHMRLCEVDRSGEEWVYTPAAHKNAWRGHSRTVVLGPQAQKALQAWLDVRKPGETDWVFPGRRKTICVTRSGYCRAIARAREAAGVYLYPYQCRHAAKDRADREMGERFAQSMMGHASPDMTRKYAKGAARREDVERAKEVARRLG